LFFLDAHVVVWLAFDPSRLSRKATSAIDHMRKNGDGLAICDITYLRLIARSVGQKRFPPCGERTDFRSSWGSTRRAARTT
jgi:PIN domain nuclease of toxin-antitoxin system